MRKKKAKEAKPLQLDLGCGPNMKPGFVGVDVRKFDGVDVVCDLGRARWPWGDSTVDEIHCSHMIEHLDAKERIHFVNEAYRVLKPGRGATLIAPDWSSCRAYGDLTHKWPPVSQFWCYYLNAAWRAVNAPHNDGYTCDFEPTGTFSMSPGLVDRNAEMQQFAMANYKDSTPDIMIVLTSLKK